MQYRLHTAANGASSAKADATVSSLIRLAAQQGKMERDIVIALAAEWRKTGHPAIVMNDGTIPDIILGLGSSGDDSWLPVQMKTTSQARLKNGKSYASAVFKLRPVLATRPAMRYQTCSPMSAISPSYSFPKSHLKDEPPCSLGTDQCIRTRLPAS